MGVVYLAEQDSPRRAVALKLLRLDSASPRQLERFEREAELLGRLSHPGIARVYEAGWAETETDWRRVVERPDIDIVDVSTPGDSHAEIAIAAARAGKAVICEKPLANSVKDAERMLAAVDTAGVVHMVCHNYRRVPAVMLARQLITDGRIGDIRHYRGTYLQDWVTDPDVPLTWRFDRRRAGSVRGCPIARRRSTTGVTSPKAASSARRVRTRAMHSSSRGASRASSRCRTERPKPTPARVRSTWGATPALVAVAAPAVPGRGAVRRAR